MVVLVVMVEVIVVELAFFGLPHRKIINALLSQLPDTRYLELFDSRLPQIQVSSRTVTDS